MDLKKDENYHAEERIVIMEGKAPSPNPNFPSNLSSMNYSFKSVLFDENKKPFGWGDSGIRYVSWGSFSFDHPTSTNPDDVIGLIKERLLRERKDIDRALAVIENTTPIFIGTDKNIQTKVPEFWKDKGKKAS